MDDSSVQNLLRFATPKQFRKGDYICHEGMPGDEMYIIVTGRVEVHIKNLNDDDALVDVKEAGGFFGEMSVLDNQPRSATCVATENTICIAIRRDQLTTMMVTCPEMAQGLLTDMAHRLRKMNDRIYKMENTETSVRIQPFVLPKGFREHAFKEEKWAPEKYLITTVSKCPVCGRETAFHHLRMNEVMCLKVLNNQRHIYSGFEILWHFVWKCQKCGYANYHANFYKMPDVNHAMVLRLISMQNKYLERVITRYPCDQVILDYYRAIHFNESFNSANVTLIAKLWRYLCWLYTDVDDLEMANFCRDKALFYYRYVHQKGQNTLQTEDSRQQCAMIIAELYLEKGEFEKARPYYDEVIKYKGKILAQHAYDRLLEIMDG